AVGDVDLDDVTVAHEADRAALRRLGRDMADREAGRAARETAIRDERAILAEPFRLEVAGRIEHLLHARTAARTFVADHDHIAGDHPVAEDRLHRRILALVDLGGPGE